MNVDSLPTSPEGEGRKPSIPPISNETTPPNPSQESEVHEVELSAEQKAKRLKANEDEERRIGAWVHTVEKEDIHLDEEQKIITYIKGIAYSHVRQHKSKLYLKNNFLKALVKKFVPGSPISRMNKKELHDILLRYKLDSDADTAHIDKKTGCLKRGLLPPSVRKDGTMYRIINVISHEDLKGAYIQTQQPKTRDDLDSHRIPHLTQWNILLNNYMWKKNDNDNDSSVSKGSSSPESSSKLPSSDSDSVNPTSMNPSIVRDPECFGRIGKRNFSEFVAEFEHVDDDISSDYDHLTVNSLISTISFMNRKYREKDNDIRKSGNHKEFPNYVKDGEEWLLYYYIVMHRSGDFFLAGIADATLPDDVFGVSESDHQPPSDASASSSAMSSAERLKLHKAMQRRRQSLAGKKAERQMITDRVHSQVAESRSAIRKNNFVQMYLHTHLYNFNTERTLSLLRNIRQETDDSIKALMQEQLNFLNESRSKIKFEPEPIPEDPLSSSKSSPKVNDSTALSSISQDTHRPSSIPITPRIQSEESSIRSRNLDSNDSIGVGIGIDEEDDELYLDARENVNEKGEPVPPSVTQDELENSPMSQMSQLTASPEHE